MSWIYILESPERCFLSGITKNHYFYFIKRFNNRYLTLVSFISQIDLFFKLLKYRDDDVLFYINTMLPFGAGLAGNLQEKESTFIFMRHRYHH